MKTTKKEKWVPLSNPEFSKFFSISNHGRLKRNAGFFPKKQRNGPIKDIWKDEKIIPLRKMDCGSLFGTIYVRNRFDEKTALTVIIRREMAKAFLRMPKKIENKNVIHKNGDHNDFRLENLKWVTIKEKNDITMERNPHMRNSLKEANIKSGYYKSITKSAWEHKDKIKSLKAKGYRVEWLAQKFGCSQPTIYNILKS